MVNFMNRKPLGPDRLDSDFNNAYDDDVDEFLKKAKPYLEAAKKKAAAASDVKVEDTTAVKNAHYLKSEFSVFIDKNEEGELTYGYSSYPLANIMGVLIFVVFIAAIVYNYYSKHRVPARIREKGAAERRERIERARRQKNNTCLNCEQVAELPIYIDCGHVFCSRCIIDHVTKRPVLSDCPHCQQTFHKIVEIGWSVEGSKGEDVRETIKTYNKNFEDVSFTEYLLNQPRYLWESVANSFRHRRAD